MSTWATGYSPTAAWSGLGWKAPVDNGAGLARHLTRAGIEVVEVNRPNRQLCRSRSKTDTVDAENAAQAALGPSPNLDRCQNAADGSSFGVKSRTQTIS